ncbi:MAG: thiamine pyrophosphate-binding protein [Methanobrevibacter sp.]|jgi:acetolactate synthase-1/2/3 large subunit|nr:thiamine pyrophosphate-binding protein [Methanobrevibacter sp.]
MNTAEALVKILEESGVEYVFGHPGEQILPFYYGLSKSKIKHILCRNEQGAGIAADGYSRSSGKFGVCVSTAGPGAINLIQGVATAYRDSIPLLVITSDVSQEVKGLGTFQDFDLNSIFKPTVVKSFNPHNGKKAIVDFKEAIERLLNEPTGPIHFNVPKDVFLDENLGEVLNKVVTYSPNYDYSKVEEAFNKLTASKRPLIIVGGGIFFSNYLDEFKEFLHKNNIPMAYTYNGKGVINSDDKLNLGMVGIRGSSIANYAFKNSDCILVLGAKLSDRSLNVNKLPLTNIHNIFNDYKHKTIHVNNENNSFKGKINIYGNIKELFNKFNSLLDLKNSNINLNNGINNNSNNNHNDKNKLFFNNIDEKWLDEIYLNDEDIENDVPGIYHSTSPLKPQHVIYHILNQNKNSITVNDAGSHTTWVAILSNPNESGRFLASGTIAPMGYAIPAAIGANLAQKDKKTIAIVGDGGIQMNIQELATIAENNLPIAIFLLNNQQLGIIRQWEHLFFEMDNYEVDLSNPNFELLSKSYGIEYHLVKTSEDLKIAIEHAKSILYPVIYEIIVDKEDIPLPKPDIPIN